MSDRIIMVREFEERLAAICLGGAGSAFPRRSRDRHILYRSIIQTLNHSKKYSEGNLNEALQRWLCDIGTCLDIDHVRLRRYLIDEGYLFRDANGSAYEVRLTSRSPIEFEGSVEFVDPSDVIQAAKARVAERKRARTLRDQT